MTTHNIQASNTPPISSRFPSALGFGAGAAALGLYVSDWKLINQYIPFYGGRFKEEED